MPALFVIAGPPGVGKTTNAKDYIPDGVEIIDDDVIVQHCRERGELNPEQRREEITWNLIHRAIDDNLDFALHLNLGTDAQYKLLDKVHSYCRHYDIRLILFYTPQERLCLIRASVRVQEGGHEVKPMDIEYMYQMTLPLLQQKIGLFAYERFINVTYNSVRVVYEGNYPDQHDFVEAELPKWVTKYFPKITHTREH